MTNSTENCERCGPKYAEYIAEYLELLNANKKLYPHAQNVRFSSNVDWTPAMKSAYYVIYNQWLRIMHRQNDIEYLILRLDIEHQGYCKK